MLSGNAEEGEKSKWDRRSRRKENRKRHKHGKGRQTVEYEKI